MKRRILFSFLFLVQFIFGFSQPVEQKPLSTPFSPTGRPRMAAEWEPALGVLIAWPLSIPHKLVIELSKDTKLYLLVTNQKSKQDAIHWLTKWGILPDRVKFLTAPQGMDVSWTRDWGPHAVFSADGTLNLADGKYIYSTPMTGLACEDSLRFLFYDENKELVLTKTDDQIPFHIAPAMDMEIFNLPFSFTGGNVISDGQRSAFSTCVLTNENRYSGVSDKKFFHDAKQLLGIEQYNIISNFEDLGIQHIDCFMKLLDEERILVMRPPADHPSYDQYEGIVQHELSLLTNAYGRPYQILRLDTDRYHEDELAAYSNSLILNKTIYVPLFGIPQDSVAMRQWKDAMPGYAVKGFDFILKNEPALRPQVDTLYENIGWKGSDALHCRTRAIWDPNMIYMSVDRLPAKVNKAKEYKVQVIIKDYSKGGLVPDSLKLMWRVKGKPEWKEIKLNPTTIPDQFTASIQGGQAGVTIQYYAIAKSNWGTYEAMPRTAPAGWYEFRIE